MGLFCWYRCYAPTRRRGDGRGELEDRRKINFVIAGSIGG